MKAEIICGTTGIKDLAMEDTLLIGDIPIEPLISNVDFPATFDDTGGYKI